MSNTRFRSEEERNAELKQTLIDVIQKGDNVSKIIEILALSSSFYGEKYPLQWDKIKTNEMLIEHLCKMDPALDKERPPKTIDVPFAYFMLKNNQQVLLQRLIHEAGNSNRQYRKPSITIPYRFVKGEDENGKPTMIVQYLPKYDGTEDSTKTRIDLKDIKYGSMRYFNYLNLPSYIDLLSRDEVIEQLRPFYLKDQIVLNFAKILKETRYIDLLNGAVNLQPLKIDNFDDKKNIYGFGVTLTDNEAWERMEAERRKFELEHPELVEVKN